MQKILFSLIILVLLLIVPQSLSAKSIATQKKNFIENDKIMHFVSSSFLTYWNYSFSKNILQLDKQRSIVVGISFASFEGFSKELSDKYIKKHTMSKTDLIADIAGICVGIILIQSFGG